jgi:hypothetical protein
MVFSVREEGFDEFECPSSNGSSVLLADPILSEVELDEQQPMGSALRGEIKN